jgi:AraC-like DNA-binding protein
MRRLDEEGTSFQKLKDLIRRDKAIFYLQQETYSIGTVAEKIGFSDPAVFTRAFKKWTGISPKAYRKKIKPAEF